MKRTKVECDRDIPPVFLEAGVGPVRVRCDWAFLAYGVPNMRVLVLRDEGLQGEVEWSTAFHQTHC